MSLTMNGIFITFEGNYGAGKSTQTRILADTLRRAGNEVVVVCEPAGTFIGEEIGRLFRDSIKRQGMCPAAELLLINAARAQLCHEVIRPALQAGHIVISDGFYDSSYVHQHILRKLSAWEVGHAISVAIGSQEEFPCEPDITFYLKVSPEVAIERIKLRNNNPDGLQSEVTIRKISTGFDIVCGWDMDRMITVDAEQNELCVFSFIWKALGTKVQLSKQQNAVHLMKKTQKLDQARKVLQSAASEYKSDSKKKYEEPKVVAKGEAVTKQYEKVIMSTEGKEKRPYDPRTDQKTRTKT